MRTRTRQLLVVMGLAAGAALGQQAPPPPTISNLTPGQLFVGQPAPVQIYGGGFLATDRVTGVPGEVTTTFVSSSQITLAPTATAVASPAVWCVDVVRGGTGQPSYLRRLGSGSTRNVGGPIPLPVIHVLEDVQPRQIAARSGDTEITVIGSRWTVGMSPTLVLLDASTRVLVARLATVMVDERTLRGRVLAAQLTAQRQYAVAVWLTPHPAWATPEHCAADMVLTAAAPVNLTVGPAEEALTLTSIDPAQRPAGSAAFRMRLNGTGFRAGAVVRWTAASGTVREFAADYRTSALLEATVSADLVAAAGNALVMVVNPDGKTTNTATFLITPVFALASISPTVADAGSAALTLTVSGTGFARGATVRWNGTALATTFVSETQLTALVPAALLERPGTATVLVANPDGTSAQTSFTIRSSVALVTGLSPASVQVNSGGFPLTVSGRGFLNGAVVQWDGMGLPTTWRSSTQLEAQVSAGLVTSTRTVQIRVVNPQAAPSEAVAFFVSPPPAPSLDNLAPARTAAGSDDFTLVVNGARFMSGATVRWNGEDLPTTYRSASQVGATVLGNRLTRVGTVQITAANPGSAVSAALTFTITAPEVSPALGGLGGTVSGATQGSVTVNLSAEAALEVQGTLTAQFAANAANLGSGCQPESGLGFVSGQNRARTRTFVIGAGERSVSIPFEVGTVAGAITIRLTALTSAGADVLQGRSVTSTITVERSGPSITANSVRIENATGSSFDVSMSGAMTGRELTEAEFTFTGASTARLETSTVTVDLRQAAPQWFQSADGCAAGGRFSLRVPFTTANGDNTSIASVSVVLRNGTQASGAISGGR